MSCFYVLLKLFLAGSLISAIVLCVLQLISFRKKGQEPLIQSFRGASTASLAPAWTTTALPCTTSRTSSTSGLKSDGPPLLLLRRLTLPLVRLYKKSRVQTYFITMPDRFSLAISVCCTLTYVAHLLHIATFTPPSLALFLFTHTRTYAWRNVCVVFSVEESSNKL